jgi:ribonucleotide reductase alpha subunit
MQLDDHIIQNNDFTYDLFALRTLERSYLMRNEHGDIIERPQYMLMRVAASLYDTVDEIVNCYNALSAKEYTHATPTLFNTGMPNGQYASCFLGCMQDDSILGIFNTVKQLCPHQQDCGRDRAKYFQYPFHWITHTRSHGKIKWNCPHASSF